MKSVQSASDSLAGAAKRGTAGPKTASDLAASDLASNDFAGDDFAAPDLADDDSAALDFASGDSAAPDFTDESLAILREVVAKLGGQARASQEQMVRETAAALTDSEHLIVQAGTGTGKSFAYLVPALLWCAQQQHRVIVSTATLALQRQIMRRDAPLVASVIGAMHGTTPQVALLKGWNNYACLRKAAGGYPEEGALLSRMEAEYGTLKGSAIGEEVMRARDWALNSDTGDRDDLVPGVSDRVWAQVSVPKRECIGESCPLRDSCFPLLARYAAEEADLVVTNHAMLGVASAGTPVLPPTDAYVVDEAHVLVDRVTSQLTASLSRSDVTAMARLLRRSGLDDYELDTSADELERALNALAEERITEISPALNEALARLLGRVQEAQDAVESMKPNGDDQALMRQILRTRLADCANMAQVLLSQPLTKGNLVAWSAEVDGDLHRLYVAPLAVARDLANHIFADVPVILTSATMKIGGGFAPIAHQVGFDLLASSGMAGSHRRSAENSVNVSDEWPRAQGKGWRAIDVGTPFKHGEQGILYVAAHLPEPGKDGYGEENLAELLQLMEASGGGTLGLFTSRAGAERAAEYVRAHSDLPVLCQGEDQLPTLVEQFAADDAASLFGTISLWQGVDVPGRTLRLVVIDRIPFPRPNDPLTAARSELAAAARRNPFMEVSATQAALLLAQGAGRLLRRVDDRGVVAVLDSRLRTKRYAGFLLRSLPQFWRTTDQDVVCAALERLNYQL